MEQSKRKLKRFLDIEMKESKKKGLSFNCKKSESTAVRKKQIAQDMHQEHQYQADLYTRED